MNTFDVISLSYVCIRRGSKHTLNSCQTLHEFYYSMSLSVLRSFFIKSQKEILKQIPFPIGKESQRVPDAQYLIHPQTVLL